MEAVHIIADKENQRMRKGPGVDITCKDHPYLPTADRKCPPLKRVTSAGERAWKCERGGEEIGFKVRGERW